MNVRLRAELLNRFWHMVDANTHQNITAQDMFGVSPTQEVSDEYLQALDEFFRDSTPWFISTWHEKNKDMVYNFPKRDECIDHLLYKIILTSKPTFLRFFIAAYCKEDPDSVLTSDELWPFMVQWTLKHGLSVEYLPCKHNFIMRDLEDIGYTRCNVDGKTGVWGLKLGL